MHSNRMRTDRFSGCLYLRVSASGSRGVSASGSRGVSASESGGSASGSRVSTTPPFTTHPVDRQTPVKTLPCLKLRLRAVINTSMNSDKSFALMTTQPYIVHGLQNGGRPCSLTLIQRSSGVQLQLCCFSYN